MEKISYKLDIFEGPLDLLLYLIKKNKLNICDIQISELLEQYMKHINRMEEQNMDISSEFLEMAARLVYIKTVLLLPKHEEAEELKNELQGQLIEYDQCRETAKILAENMSFDFIARETEKIEFDMTYSINHNVFEILKAYTNLVGKKHQKLPPTKESFSGIVSKKIVSVFSKVVFILKKIRKVYEVNFNSLFYEAGSKSEMVATFLAILELIKRKRIYLEEDNEKIRLLNGEVKVWK